jgi:uncharacterized protein
MDSISRLNSAKIKVKQGQFQEAITLFEAIAKERSDASPEAAYCLAILYQSGSGLPVNLEEAIRYYSIAEQAGYSMATYRLAGIYQRRGEAHKAFNSYRSIAQINPSAAYWSYRLLVSDNLLDTDPQASDKYLNSAADQGHVLAQRDKSIKYALGKKGALKIPYGLYLFVKMAYNSFHVTARGDKLRYE